MEWLQYVTVFYNVIRPVLDIGILAFLLYKAYELLVKTQSAQMIKIGIFVILVYGTAKLFRLTTLEWILNLIISQILVIVAVVFQPELRRIIVRLGQSEFFRPDKKPRLGNLEAVVTAAEILSRRRPKPRGMLIVFPQHTNIKNIIDTGTRINGDISSSLIVAIFEFDTPLHDGAMIIQNGKIIAAGCFLPLSEQQDIKKSFGTRHRASLGMSEQSDAVVLVVSEETGAMSIAFDGKLYYDLSTKELTQKLRGLIDRNARTGNIQNPESEK
ncbi:membrane protein [Spirochaetia bacterium]|nr:membrane protein [Spirochaetia bacterium]